MIINYKNMLTTQTIPERKTNNQKQIGERITCQSRIHSKGLYQSQVVQLQ